MDRTKENTEVLRHWPYMRKIRINVDVKVVRLVQLQIYRSTWQEKYTSRFRDDVVSNSLLAMVLFVAKLQRLTCVCCMVKLQLPLTCTIFVYYRFLVACYTLVVLERRIYRHLHLDGGLIWSWFWTQLIDEITKTWFGLGSLSDFIK